ncbi:MAG: hypothetical protein M0Q42_05135 [Xanthomonadales bacterium]|nr:hypothetical protein [Xanthomonadales bacterium]
MTGWIELGRRLLPRTLRHGLQRLVSLDALKMRVRARQSPLASVTSGDDDRHGGGVRLGILANRASYHTHYVAACQEMGVPFRVVDPAVGDWQRQIKGAGCDLWLAWPDATLSHWAKMYKDRCELIQSQLGVPVYPGPLERWFYEDKIRLADWLQATGLPHPRTWVFFHAHEAGAFAGNCELPIVFKLPFGAGATGVRIVHSRRQLRRLIRQAFGRGHVAAGHERRDRQRGSILLQEYLPQLREWRMVRIGDSYFGHPKGRLGQFHSGSGKVEWDMPGKALLDLLHQVTQGHGMRSMSMDVFELPDGRVLINELQTVFGASVAVHQLKRDGVPGRMVRDVAGDWHFESGDFARNACATARVMDAVQQIRGRG